MLQQTQVKTVLPYFKKFTKKFPTLESLSKSNEKQILKMWEGLGYYRRARNLYACSNQLINLYKGKLPKTLDEIKKLPGIGDYTGSALLGLVYDQPRIAVAGNVKIGKNCWIGLGSKIIENCVIGDNVFVAAGAVVTKNVKSNR